MSKEIKEFFLKGGLAFLGISAAVILILYKLLVG